MIGAFLLMAIVDGRALLREHDTKEWIVYLAMTTISSTILILYSSTFTKPNILTFMEAWLRPISRWMTG